MFGTACLLSVEEIVSNISMELLLFTCSFSFTRWKEAMICKAVLFWFHSSLLLISFLCLGQDGQKEKALGMAGKEASPASLFQLYVDYGRLTEATNLLLEYMEAFASSVSFLHIRICRFARVLQLLMVELNII